MNQLYTPSANQQILSHGFRTLNGVGRSFYFRGFGLGGAVRAELNIGF
mgnify:CR=1